MDESAFTTGKFNWIEYTTFGSLLGLSVVIGLYYGCIKGNQNTVSEYMLGGKQMSVFPIVMSLIASHVSGISLLGIPAEVYEFGTQYVMTALGAFIVAYATNKFYLPVFYPLQLYSVYEYLELRFSKTVRKLCSLIFASALLCYVPLVVYIPALAFQQVSGTPVHYLTPVICSLCIFYTTIGGLKAVVWTDTIQGVFILVVTTMVMILGIISVGGLQNVYSSTVQGDRWEFFNFDINPLSRVTFWTASIGSFSLWIVALTVHPGSSQRFVALPTMKAAQTSVIFFCVGINLLNALSAFVGAVMYAKYEKCDPLKANVIQKSSQILPYFVQDVASSYPGLTGLLVSGLVSAALSTMSAGLNTVAGTIYEDFIEPCMPKYTTEGVASTAMKIIVILFGCICVLLVYVVEKLGSIIQMSYSLSSCQNGAIFAAFALGLFFPGTNSKGAVSGIISSLAVSLWIVFGAESAKMNGHLIQVGRHTSVEGCNMNMTGRINDVDVFSGFQQLGNGVYAHKDVNSLYAISFLYYTPIGAIVGIVVGLVVSYATGGNNLRELDPKLITPCMRKFLPKFNVTNLDEYKPVADELKVRVVSSAGDS